MNIFNQTVVNEILGDMDFENDNMLIKECVPLVGVSNKAVVSP